MQVFGKKLSMIQIWQIEHKFNVFAACKSAKIETEIEQNFNAYAERHRLIAIDSVKLKATDYVGHIKTIRKVIEHLEKALAKSDGSKQSTGVLANRIRALALPDSSPDKRAAMVWFERNVFSKLPGYMRPLLPATLRTK